MAVRRLHAEQPANFAFTADNLAWSRETIAKYPAGKQASAVIPVLWRAQEQNDGWVSEPALRAVADLLDMPYIRVYEIATFYTMFQLAPVGRKAHIQVCGTTPCMLRGAEDLIDICKRRIADQPLHLSTDGDFSWEEVECLGSCANAPMVQIGKDTYEDLTPDTMRRLIDGIARGRTPKPGSQTDRKASCPAGGATTLKDPSLYDGSTIGAWKKRFAEVTEAAANTPAADAKLPKAEREPAPASATSQEVSPDAKPPLLAERPADADNLSLIWGVGPKLTELLNSLGIYKFSQIAAWTDTQLRWVDQHLAGFEGRADRDKWVEQAKKLATGWRPTNGAGDRVKD